MLPLQIDMESPKRSFLYESWLFRASCSEQKPGVSRRSNGNSLTSPHGFMRDAISVIHLGKTTPIQSHG